jgi:hypothetical protein
VNNRISKRKFKNYKNSKVREFLRKTSGKIRVAGIAACFWWLIELAEGNLKIREYRSTKERSCRNFCVIFILVETTAGIVELAKCNLEIAEDRIVQEFLLDFGEW